MKNPTQQGKKVEAGSIAGNESVKIPLFNDFLGTWITERPWGRSQTIIITEGHFRLKDSENNSFNFAVHSWTVVNNQNNLNKEEFPAGCRLTGATSDYAGKRYFNTKIIDIFLHKEKKRFIYTVVDSENNSNDYYIFEKQEVDG